jgi:hypothetical protein
MWKANGKTTILSFFLDGLFQKTEIPYSHLKEEALDRTMWRNRFRGGFGPVVRQNTEWMNEYKKLLDDLKDRRGYSHLKEEALDRTIWRNRFGGGFGPVVRQNTE